MGNAEYMGTTFIFPSLATKERGTESSEREKK